MSDASWYHHREAQKHSPEHSHSPFLAGGMNFPPPSGMLDPCQSSSNNWKLISFNTTWLHHQKNKIKIIIYIYIHIFFSISSSFSLPFSPSLASLYLFEQCLTVHSHQTRRERQSGRKSLIFNESRRRAPARAAQRVLDVESIEESWNQVNFMVMSYDAVGRQPIRM